MKKLLTLAATAAMTLSAFPAKATPTYAWHYGQEFCEALRAGADWHGAMKTATREAHALWSDDIRADGDNAARYMQRAAEKECYTLERNAWAEYKRNNP